MAAAGRALVDGYDLLLVDLDGVVYLSDEPIPHAVKSLTDARRGGRPVRYVTNNASRPPSDVAAALRRLGLIVEDGDIETAAMTAAAELARRLPAASAVLVVGGPGLSDAVRAAGLQPVGRAQDAPLAVVQGFGSQVGWSELAEACVAIRAGVPWLATNLDRTLPSPRGPLPGNGSLVAALATATDVTPESVGKPQPDSFRRVADGLHAHRPLVIGDRADTDISGAHAAGYDCLLVLTGVSGIPDLLRAPPLQRPTYVAADLRGLHHPPAVVTRKAQQWRCGQAVVTTTGEHLTATGSGGRDGLDRVRAAAAAVWAGATSGDRAVDDLAAGRLDLDLRSGLSQPDEAP